MNEEQRESVRLAVYREFARTGRAPSSERLGDLARVDSVTVTSALRELHASRDLVLDDSDDIVMAHPFTSVPLGFSVMGRRTLWWGGCAWDSFAIPHLIDAEPQVLVATDCPGCGAAHAWNVTRDNPPDGDQVAHFLTPMDRVWRDVVHACGNQRLFCSRDCVTGWSLASGNPVGYVMDLATLWRLARGWYAGRLDRGYVRREPKAAAGYFRDVGLRGPFWGL